MKLFLRHLAVCALPLAFGIGASFGFTRIQGSCTAMVGPIFSAKCHGRQREYQLKFQLAGTGLGTVIAAALGTWLEHRRRRVVQPANPPSEAS